MPRQPSHIRNGRITGDTRQLNKKAIKVLSVIKFSPTSLSREDIVDKTGLNIQDVQRQVKLLLGYNLISQHRHYPSFPQQGWKVYTQRDKHSSIINILKQHGIEDPRVVETRSILGDYYPTGLELEGDGKQPYRNMTYTKGHPIIPELEFRPEAIRVMTKFRDEIKPFRPKEFSEEAVEKKKIKWNWFVDKMSKAYNLNPKPNVEFGIFTPQSWNRPGSSSRDDDGQSSHYRPSTNTLYFTGKFSLTTLLHEFGHARGFDERDTIIWSINFGIRFFPVTYNRLLEKSDEGTHMLIRPNEPAPNFTGFGE